MLDTKCKVCYTPDRKANFTSADAGVPGRKLGAHWKGGGQVTNRIAELRKARRISQAVENLRKG